VSDDVLVPPDAGDDWPVYLQSRSSRPKVIDVRRVDVHFTRSRGGSSLRGLLSTLLRSSQPDDVWALRGVEITVRSGECVGIVGRNGAGKTTLLRVMAGLLHHDAGSVRVRGRISALLNLGVGFDPLLTGRENVRLVGSLMGLSRSETRARLPDVLEFAEIGDSIDAPLRTYSSGMRARLGFATAASMIEPHVLLLDEVMGTGDAAFRERSRQRVMELVERAHAVVVTSHDMGWISEFATYAVLLDGGAVIAEGAPPGVTTLHRARSVKRRYGCPTCAGSWTDRPCPQCGVWRRIPEEDR
jgi:ABC-type polysaccharide/polyol phosphate transport system ATPase subunit